jgi:hypothetical protein
LPEREKIALDLDDRVLHHRDEATGEECVLEMLGEFESFGVLTGDLAGGVRVDRPEELLLSRVETATEISGATEVARVELGLNGAVLGDQVGTAGRHSYRMYPCVVWLSSSFR